MWAASTSHDATGFLLAVLVTTILLLLITYIFIPRGIGGAGSLQPLWVLFALWFLWFIGEKLEAAWGAFPFTLYFLVGMIGTTVAAFLFGAQFSNSMLAASIFL